MTRRTHIRNEILVLRCQQGDGDAFADLAQRWQTRLWRHAYHVTGDRDAASDVVQDSWLAVMKGIRRLHDADAFPTWAFRIVTNKSRDWARRQHRRWRLREWLTRHERQLDTRPDPQDDRVDSLRAALACLTADQRALITLYYQEGFTTQEVADILAIPRGTVKSRLYHARDRIRRQMEDETDA